MDTPPENGAEVRELVEAALRVSARRGDLRIVPSLLLEEVWLSDKKRDRSRRTMADRVLAWFIEHGFLGDRTFVQPFNGYPGLFHELIAPAPWIEVEPSDCLDDVPEKRATELRPFYRWCLEEDPGHIRHRYERYLDERRDMFEEKGIAGYDLVRQTTLASFDEKVALARVVGGERIEYICSVLAVDGFPHVPAGSPDLLLWHPDPALQLWFFAEVKGPRDHLRRTQYEWVSEHWDAIAGRFLLVLMA